MIRIYLALGAVTGVLAIIGAVYFAGGQAARKDNALDRARDTINASEDFNDAIRNPDGCAWLDRLRGECPD